MIVNVIKDDSFMELFHTSLSNYLDEQTSSLISYFFLQTRATSLWLVKLIKTMFFTPKESEFMQTIFQLQEISHHLVLTIYFDGLGLFLKITLRFVLKSEHRKKHSTFAFLGLCQILSYAWISNKKMIGTPRLRSKILKARVTWPKAGSIPRKVKKLYWEEDSPGELVGSKSRTSTCLQSITVNGQFWLIVKGTVWRN